MSAPMRAWRSGEKGRGGLELVQVEKPRPGPGDALVQVKYGALNYSDQLMVDDAYQVRPPRPFVPGQEVAGLVMEAGEGCGLEPGDRVASKLLWGGFADFALIRGTMALRVPDGVPLDIAATLPVVYTTATVALTESTAIAARETVLVLAAAGGVGLAAVEVAAALGARVLAAAGGPEKGALARHHGAEIAIDYRAEDWVGLVKAATGGRGVDVVFDPVGGDEGLAALRLLATGGRYLVVGFASGKIPQIPANRLLLKRASAIGVYWSHDTDGPMLERVNARLSGLLASGAIRPHVGAVYDFDDLPSALADLAERRTTGKVLLRVGGVA